LNYSEPKKRGFQISLPVPRGAGAGLAIQINNKLKASTAIEREYTEEMSPAERILLPTPRTVFLIHR